MPNFVGNDYTFRRTDYRRIPYNVANAAHFFIGMIIARATGSVDFGGGRKMRITGGKNMKYTNATFYLQQLSVFLRGLLVTIIVGTAANASPIVDQQVGPLEPRGADFVVNSQYLAQTLTVGVSGILTEILLQLYHFSDVGTNFIDTVTPFKIELLHVLSDGSPDTDNVVFSSVLDASIIPIESYANCLNVICPVIPYTPVDISSFNIHVNENDVFALFLSRENPQNSGYLGWVVDSSNLSPYSGGAEYRYQVSSGSFLPADSRSLSFATCVDPDNAVENAALCSSLIPVLPILEMSIEWMFLLGLLFFGLLSFLKFPFNNNERG